MLDHSGSDWPFDLKCSENDQIVKNFQFMPLWRDAHLARSKFTAENFSAARSESGELSRDGNRPSIYARTKLLACIEW